MKSIYVVFPEAGHVELRDEEVAPPGPGEVVCVAQKSLVSIGTETSCLRGVFDPGTNWAGWVKYPFRPGYSMAARVVAVGKGVTSLKEGDRVACWSEHQQFFKAEALACFSVPDRVSDEEATWCTLAVTTQLAVRRAQLSLGESSGVVGLGILGQLVVQYLALSGARRIVAIDPAPVRQDLARKSGATHALALEASDAGTALLAITEGRLLDVIFDVTGHPAVLAQCFPLLHKLGRVVLLGDTPTPTRQTLGPGLVSDSLTVLGIHGTMTADEPTVFNPWTRREAVMLFLDYLLQGRMRVAHLITHRYSPLAAPDVYAKCVADRSFAVGILFDWTGLPLN